MTDSDHLFDRLAEAVTTMKPELVAELARKVLEQGLSPQDAMPQGLAAGMRRMGEKFAAKECFVPEVLLASKAMYAGFDILSKAAGYKPQAARGKVALGVVQGDIHDIGKNIAITLLDAHGFTVVDLGVDVAPARIAEAVANEQPDVLGLSCLLTTAFESMRQTVAVVRESTSGWERRVPVVVGGAVIDQHTADRVGADGWCTNAADGIKAVRSLLG